jgi:site-specific recombinase XerD
VVIEMTYQEEQVNEYNERLQNILQQLPKFCKEYFIGKQSKSIKTHVTYAINLKTFFDYLTKEKPINEVSDLNNITEKDIDAFLSYIGNYKKGGKIVKNGDAGKLNKINTLRSFFKFFYIRKEITYNPMLLVESPKLKDKPIVRLKGEEINQLIAAVDSETGKTRARNRAIIYLFLNSGIRLSEMVGININNIDFEHKSFKITRKGGDEVILYFNDTTKQVLLEYLAERSLIKAKDKYKEAFFLSSCKQRITKQSVENLVKRYTFLVTKLKNVTPHGLRRTFGTELYKRSKGNLKLVQTMLGHSDIKVTEKHYVDLDDEEKMNAAELMNF